MTQPQPSTRIIQALEDVINDEYNERFNATPEGRRIKEVATAMFQRAWHGQRPEQLAMGFPGGDPAKHLARVGNGTVAIMYPLQPAWATYAEHAREAIELTKATEERTDR